MVSAWSVAAIAATLLICFAGPVVAMILLARRARRTWRAFWCGMAAFFVSQVATRLPLMLIVVPTLPEPARGILQSIPVASFSAGLFEETGRLVVMLLLMKGFRRLVDGVAFGLGHGGLEAMLVVGLTSVNNLIFAVLMNTGQWAPVAASIPAEAASQIERAMTQTAPSLFWCAGLERVGAVALHVACSLLVLAGIVRGRKLVFWLAAVVLHGLANVILVSAVAAGFDALAGELLFVAATAVVLFAIVRRVGPTYPPEIAEP